MGFALARCRSLSLSCFHASFFLFAPFCGHPSSSPFPSTFSPFTPLKKGSVLQSKEHSTELGEGRFQDGPFHKDFGKEIPSRNLREKRSAIIWAFLDYATAVLMPPEIQTSVREGGTHERYAQRDKLRQSRPQSHLDTVRPF